RPIAGVDWATATTPTATVPLRLKPTPRARRHRRLDPDECGSRYGEFPPNVHFGDCAMKCAAADAPVFLRRFARTFTPAAGFGHANEVVKSEEFFFHSGVPLPKLGG